MTNKQAMCIDEAVRCLQSARKWLDQAMYYTEPQLPDNEQKKVRAAYDTIANQLTCYD